MCGRYGRRADKQRIAEWFRTHNTDVFNDDFYEANAARFAPSWNIAPESMQPVVRQDRDTGERVLALMKWGLVPFWSKTPRANFSSINARDDKLASSAAWREPWKHRRCLVPANFFYEWQPLTKDEEKKKISKPWAVSLPDQRLFAFGGIWDQWKGQDDKMNQIVVESFSIVTTEPNELLAPFHNRCPLIVSSAHRPGAHMACRRDESLARGPASGQRSASACAPCRVLCMNALPDCAAPQRRYRSQE
jgi:putative SOS response-associated peptidase YedK